MSSGPRHRGPQSQAGSSALEGLLGPAPRAAGAVALLPAQALDPAGAGARAKAGEGQGAQAHVLAGHNELPKAFLVGEGVAGAPRAGAAHSPHAAVLGLLLLPYQLGVADLRRGQGRGVVLQRLLTTSGTAMCRGALSTTADRHGNFRSPVRHQPPESRSPDTAP